MSKIFDIIRDHYGVSPIEAPREAISWALDRLPAKDRQKAIDSINRIKEHCGKPPYSDDHQG